MNEISLDWNTIRIWYQSAVDTDQQRAYLDRLRNYLASIADPDVKFDVFGMSPPQLGFDPVTHLRCSVQVLRNALVAEAQGYDAFIIGNFPEPGLAECKAALDLPVLGLAEATLLYASTLGQKIGLVTVAPEFVPWHEQQVACYGLSQRVVGIHALQGAVRDVVAAYTDHAQYAAALAEFKQHCQRLVEAGAEVIVPAGGAAMALFARERDFSVGRAVVLNGIPVVAKQAELAVKLKRLNGTAISRAGAFAKVSNSALHDFMSLFPGT